MVGRVTRNSILKGVRLHNQRRTRRINKTGKYKSEKAPPEDMLVRRAEHLAFFSEGYYDRVVAKVNERNAMYRRKRKNGVDPRANVPKKKTRFPGQMIECGICGRLYVYGGHGQTPRLMCRGAREHACWNGITVDGPRAAEKLAEAVFREIENLPGFDDRFLESVNERALQLNTGREAKTARTRTGNHPQGSGIGERREVHPRRHAQW